MGKSKRFEINRKWEQEFIILDTIHGIQDLINLDKLEPQVEDLPSNMSRKKAKGPQNAMVTSAKRLGGLSTMRPQNYRRITNITEESIELMVVSTITPKLKIESS